MLKRLVQAAAHRLGYAIVRRENEDYYAAADIESSFRPIYEKCKPHTMTSLDKMYSLYKSVEYVCQSGIGGDLVECGVYRGGSSMVMAESLIKFGDRGRRLFMYDTYAGMSRPSAQDGVTDGHRNPLVEWRNKKRGDVTDWCYASLEEVQRNMASTPLRGERIEYVKGKVEDTIPGLAPKRIAVLRLDTDWYDSTYHELEHLYPRLVSGGVLIIDDYGYWKGSRDATDRYLRECGARLLLHRTDLSGRIAIKP